MKKNEAPKRKFAFRKIEPWPKPVSGVGLVAEIEAVCSRYLVLPPGAATAMALWVLFSHTFAAWGCSPRLVFTSKEPECGKTTALTLLAQLVPNALPTVNITPAALFRIIERHQPSLLIDEADTFIEGHEEMRGVLNSGHTRDTAFVWRCHPETLEPEAFSTWAPLAIGKIGGLAPTLQSRSIIITMRRKMPQEMVVRLTPQSWPELHVLAQKAARWSNDHLEELRQADPDMPPRLGSRVADNWRPLTALADAVGGPFSSKVRSLPALFVSDVVRLAPAAEIVNWVRTQYNLLKRPLPEYRVRQHLARLVVAKAVDPLLRELLERGAVVLDPSSVPGKRFIVPGAE